MVGETSSWLVGLFATAYDIESKIERRFRFLLDMGKVVHLVVGATEGLSKPCKGSGEGLQRGFGGTVMAQAHPDSAYHLWCEFERGLVAVVAMRRTASGFSGVPIGKSNSTVADESN
ncbi:hypothetical protein OIV83_004479 [Microbotryomycetes sp. JL201]|nr:hypothetical protein OIV83_004479 [Microbotryomycetes sp. JL201]